MKGELHEAFGEWKTYREWALIYDTTPQLIRDYVRHGHTLEEALLYRHKKQPPMKLTVDGVTKTLAQWAREMGVRRETIADRMRKGYGPEWCIYKGNLTGLARNGTIPEHQDPIGKENVKKWREGIDRKLDGLHGSKFKVRWCDRTSHSHRWEETMVDIFDLDEFMSNHYLSNVVVDW